MFSGTTLDRSHGPLALALWREASAWMRERELPIWDEDSFDDAFLEREFARGEIVGVFSGSSLAAVALLHWSDPLWWPDRATNRAAYIHKVATARAFAGSGALGVLFDMCYARARDAGKDLVRLDTPTSRPMLHAIYRRLGFTAIDTFDGVISVVRFEKSI